MDISRLRRETAADHLAVEASVRVMEEDLSLGDYVRCLSRMYGIVAAWEEESWRSAPDWLRASLKLRKRRDLLAADLACLGAAPSRDVSTLPAFTSLYSLLGAMYVMEGSKLGGQLIARHVERVLDLRRGCGDAFFLGNGDQTGRMWKEFCAMLETKVPEGEADAVILGAKAMFAAFGAWMQGIPAPIGN